MKTLGLIIISTLVLVACGGGTTDSKLPKVGSVSLYVTDNLDSYSGVTGTINAVSLQHKSTGAACILFNSPQSFDFAALGYAQIMELLTVTVCPAASYNRLHINVEPVISLTDAVGTQECRLVSYKDEKDQPNALNCDVNGCELILTGATNVVANQHREMALDFDLKSFEVDMVPDPCEVTMKVSPLHGAGISEKEIAGYTRVDNK